MISKRSVSVYRGNRELNQGVETERRKLERDLE